MGVANRVDRRFALVLAVTTVFCLLLILTFDYGRDQGIYTVVARTILEGGMPYRDAWDFKPPGIYLVYALARWLFGNAHHGIRIVEVAGLLGTIALMIRLAARWWGKWQIGMLAGALAALVHAQLDFWHSGQPETFGGMLTVAALALGTRAGPLAGAAAGRASPSRHAALHLIGCGVLFGCAGLLKPPLAGGGAVLALLAAGQAFRDRTAGARARWRRSLGPALAPLGWVLLGGVIPFAVCLGWFAAAGALGDLYETLFVFTPHYTALGWQDQNFLSLLYQAWAQWLVTFSSALTVGLLLGLASWRACYRRPQVGLVLGLIAIQLVGVALQGKFFPYHYAACWPLTALLSALGWWHVWRWAADRGRKGIVIFAVGLLLAASLRSASKDVRESFWSRTASRLRVLLPGQHDQGTMDELASVADVSAAGNRAVAQELQRLVAPGEPIYIWGFEPVIYDQADRPCASKYIYNVPQRVPWEAEQSRRALMSELLAKPPAAVLVVRYDVFPMVTGQAIDSADVLEREFSALKQLLDEQYKRYKTVQDFEIYLHAERYR